MRFHMKEAIEAAFDADLLWWFALLGWSFVDSGESNLHKNSVARPRLVRIDVPLAKKTLTSRLPHTARVPFSSFRA